ncbi:MAG: putative toxin-antitoxin system toxin component, PIN family [Anaerolineaceae bacterium]|nr:putative toxin-antitoxin system toxin component, PIN family [Anaerolineaceae bacterium]
MLDTNVLVSLLVFNSPNLEKILEQACLQNTLVLSTYIIEELYEVIERKFPGKAPVVDVFLSKIPFEVERTPEQLPQHDFFEIRDPEDEKVLYSVISANGDVFITGDKDFTDIHLKKPKILTPSQFLQKYS